MLWSVKKIAVIDFLYLTFFISSASSSWLEVGNQIFTSSSNPEVAKTGKFGCGSSTFTYIEISSFQNDTYFWYL